METYYKELGLDPGASFEQVKQAWRTLMAKYHPDRYPGPASEEMSKRVNDAYQKLKKYFESGSYQQPATGQSAQPTDLAVLKKTGPVAFEINESLLVPKKASLGSIFEIAGLVLCCITLIYFAGTQNNQPPITKQQEIASMQQYLVAKLGPENIYDWEWRVAGHNEKNEDYYVSWNQTKSLHNDFNKKQFWYRFDNETLYKATVDCHYKTMRLENITRYNANNRVGSVVDYSNTVFTPIDTSLVSGSIASQVCQRF